MEDQWVIPLTLTLGWKVFAPNGSSRTLTEYYTKTGLFANNAKLTNGDVTEIWYKFYFIDENRNRRIVATVDENDETLTITIPAGASDYTFRLRPSQTPNNSLTHGNPMLPPKGEYFTINIGVIAGSSYTISTTASSEELRINYDDMLPDQNN